MHKTTEQIIAHFGPKNVKISKKIIKAAISELFLRPRPFGIAESSYYKDQWLGYDRYLWDKMTYTSQWNSRSSRSGAEAASVRHWWDITISATRPIIKPIHVFDRLLYILKFL